MAPSCWKVSRKEWPGSRGPGSNKSRAGRSEGRGLARYIYLPGTCPGVVAWEGGVGGSPMAKEERYVLRPKAAAIKEGSSGLRKLP